MKEPLALPLTVDHVTAVVGDRSQAEAALLLLTGKAPVARVHLPALQMDVTSYALGEVELHLVCATDKEQGPAAAFHKAHGPGLHHLALRVPDLDQAMVELSGRGLRFLGTPVATAEGLREVFVDPKSVAGLLIQLVERKEVADHTELSPEGVSRLVCQAHATSPEPEGS